MKYRNNGEVRQVQETRRLAQEEMSAHEWTVKRQALVDSGLVAARAKAREEAKDAD